MGPRKELTPRKRLCFSGLSLIVVKLKANRQAIVVI
jgi:hypothetical protein